MEFNYPEEYSKSSCDIETDHRSTEQNDDTTGTGRSYECVFCRRGFTTAQALGGHMNIHRKDRANNKTKQSFPPSNSSSKVVDDNNYADIRFHSANNIPSLHLAGRNCYSTAPHEVDSANNYHQAYFPAPIRGIRSSSHVQYSDEVLGVENQSDHHLFGHEYWEQRNLSLYAEQLCVPEIKDNNEEGGLDLELRLGHHP